MEHEDQNLPTTLTLDSLWRGYKVPILLGLASLFLIALSLTLLIKSYQVVEPIQFSHSSSTGGDGGQASSSARMTLDITVDVEGAVVKPGIYHLPRGSRVDDAIAASGGLSPDADRDLIAKTVNRAAKVADDSKLYIPLQGDALQKAPNQSIFISINSASQAELEALPGIGPVTAQKIIDGRPYMSLEELVTKKAMNQSLLNKLREQLTL